MKKNFKEVIESIKESNVDEDETIKYILAIKRVVKKAYEDCKEEQTESEILQDYLEEYKTDLKFRGDAKKIFNEAIVYEAYKRVLNDYKGNKSNFDSIIKEARRRESKDNIGELIAKTDLKESMISAIRFIIRTRKLTKEKDILDAINTEKILFSNDLKDRMINIIHSSLMTLNEYGFIDEYIEDANSEMNQLGLEKLQYVKRNPIADKQYDENGKVIEDMEDIGVLDAFSKENLEQMSIEDLEMVTAFWESKYFQERIGLSKAMSTIKTLNLWDVMLHEDDEVIKNLNKEKINGALKKDLAITYLCRKDCDITEKMKKQYNKFLKEQSLQSETDLTDEINSVLPDISNLEGAAEDIATLESLIICQLLNKDMKIKKWGIVENKTGEDSIIEDFDGVTIAIENRNFRGPLLMGVSEELLKKLNIEEITKMPRYEKKLNRSYCEVMSKLYLPTNKFFNNMIKKAYKENLNSELLADLAGKKVRTGEER